jgi:beta-galactosidase
MLKFNTLRLIFILICYCWVYSAVAFSPPETLGRVKYNFNSAWKVSTGDAAKAHEPNFDDASWKIVTLPHAWNEEEAFRKDIKDLSTGIAWYRKQFKLPASQKGKKVFLEFEGVRQAGEFFVNGKFIGRHENGAMAFGFDITDLVKFGKERNVVAVRIDNNWDYKEKSSDTTFQWNNKNFNVNYGGITKNVSLHVTDKLYQTLPLYSFLKTHGVYVYADDINVPGKTARIHVESEIRNEYKVSKTFRFEALIEDINGKVIQKIDGGNVTIAAGETKSATASAVVNGLEFWSWGYGYLYTVHSIISVDNNPVDVVKTKTGFRKTGFENGMITLNDRVIMMKGYAQRTSNEWPAVGVSIPAWLSDYSNQLMVESNANLVRWMHITPSKQDIESCDRVGLIQAMPAGDAEKDATGRRWKHRIELMRDAIVYNRNNPSILFYECGNEEISEEHMRQMKAIRDQYDPHGGRAIGSREMLNSAVAEYGGEMLYINKSADIPMWAMEYSRDEALRKYWDEFSPPYHKDGDGPLYRNADASPYNRNQDSHAVENIRRWYDYWRERPGTGKRVSSGGVNIVFSDTNTHYRGSENYRRSGEVDAMRILKDGFYAHQVMWDGWVEVERPRIHLMGHWNYAPNVTKDMFVVSSAEKVELFVNGVSLGFGQQDYRFLFTFRHIAWKEGALRAVGYDKNGNQICEAQKKTAGEPAAIRLKPIVSPKGFKADGADLALVEVEVVDKDGMRCPTALNLIKFQVDGQADWKGGIGHGTPDNYILSKTLPVECGVNRILLRSTTSAGNVSIKAESEGLQSAMVTLQSKPIDVSNGLATEFPGEGLPSNLKRGPTPSGASFAPSRFAVGVTKITAGVNEQSAANTIDDDETTSWSNKNNLKDGWIRYELDREAVISEVTMKLGGWRARTYPIRILVDSTEVFNSTTERNLGYYTATFNPVKGKQVSIELVGTNTSADAFNAIVEVTGKKLESGEAATEKNVLEIIEIEFYERVANDLK